MEEAEESETLEGTLQELTADTTDTSLEELLETEDLEEETQPHYFKPTGIRNQSYWQCISYVANSADKHKELTASDAIGTYCHKCSANIKHHHIKNPHGVKRHMKRYHPEMLGQPPATKKSKLMTSFFMNKI